MNPPLASAIYEGWMQHRRHQPRPHAFRYRMCQLFLDLDEIERCFNGRHFWSVNRPNLAEFRRSDYLGDPTMPLAEAVRQHIDTISGRRPVGPIRLLTHLRYFGYCFNPVSFYYCYGTDGTTLETIVAEITNTPWNERHNYVLDAVAAERHGRTWHWRFPKAFHVSPFLPLTRDYAWRFTAPGADLHVQMDVYDGSSREFDATLALVRRSLDGIGLARVLWRYPAMTLRVTTAIYWQAFLLWLRRNPVYDHPGRHGGPR